MSLQLNAELSLNTFKWIFGTHVVIFIINFTFPSTYDKSK